MRRSTNFIAIIEEEDGPLATELKDIQQAVVEYFSSLFVSIGLSDSLCRTQSLKLDEQVFMCTLS